MSVSSVQVKTTLSPVLFEHVQKKAREIGVSVSSYIKHLVVSDVKIEEEFPVYKASKKTERLYRQAKRDIKNRKITLYDTIDDMLASI